MILVLLVALVGTTLGAEQYIVGGSNSATGRWPWQGSYRTASGGHSCGCVLIHSTWVMSAAHCGGSTGYTMEFGHANRGSGSVFGVSAISIHPDYEVGSGAYPNDISVIRAASSISGSNISPVPGFDVPGTNRPSHECWITGWGRTCGICNIPTTLQEVQIPVITDSTCASVWGGNYNSAVHMCVWDQTNQDKGACSPNEVKIYDVTANGVTVYDVTVNEMKIYDVAAIDGDSGGPMVCNDGSGWDLCGVTSWGQSQCDPQFPSVYTRVATYRSWVCSATGNAVCW